VDLGTLGFVLALIGLIADLLGISESSRVRTLLKKIAGTDIPFLKKTFLADIASGFVPERPIRLDIWASDSKNTSTSARIIEHDYAEGAVTLDIGRPPFKKSEFSCTWLEVLGLEPLVSKKRRAMTFPVMGSYAIGTVIRPSYDLDIACYLKKA